jgi:Flp pilus assembly protein TadB
MTIGASLGMLTVLIALRAANRLRPGARPLHARRPGRGRRPRRAAPDYASLLDAIARQVRTGSSLTSATLDEIDRSTPLGAIVDRLGSGSTLSDTLATVDASQPDLALTLQALSATAHLGGPIAATLDEAAAVLRERSATRAERGAQGAQARLSARVLTIVPLAFAVWSAVASERTRDVYISTAAGAICASCGLTLNVVGWRWMKRIIGPA